MRQITILIQDKNKDDIDVKIYETGNGSGETDTEQRLSRKLIQIIQQPFQELEGIKTGPENKASPSDFKTRIHIDLNDGSSLSWEVEQTESKRIVGSIVSLLGLPHAEPL